MLVQKTVEEGVGEEVEEEVELHQVPGEVVGQEAQEVGVLPEEQEELGQPWVVVEVVQQPL